jgi:predicted porin
MFDGLASFVPAAFATQYEPTVLVAGANYREDNTIKYSGQFGPVTVGAHFSVGAGLALPAAVGVATPIGGSGENPGSARRDSAYGVAVTYASGAFGATAGYDQWNPTIGTTSGTVKKALVAASYSFGVAKVMGGYRWGQNKDSSDTTIQRDDYYWIGGNYQLTPAVGLTLEYSYDNMKSYFGTNSPKPWQVLFLANYAISKRTDIYLTSAFGKNAGLMLESGATVYANSLSLGSSYVLANGQSTMFGAAVGIRHKF